VTGIYCGFFLVTCVSSFSLFLNLPAVIGKVVVKGRPVTKGYTG